MSRRLPRSIRVMGQRIGIVPVTGLTYVQHTDEDDPNAHHYQAWGLFEESGPIISIETAAGPERQKVTLVHEVLHAALNTAHITDFSEGEEDIVTRLAPVLFDIIRNNKALVAYLQEV